MLKSHTSAMSMLVNAVMLATTLASRHSVGRQAALTEAVIHWALAKGIQSKLKVTDYE